MERQNQVIAARVTRDLVVHDPELAAQGFLWGENEDYSILVIAGRPMKIANRGFRTTTGLVSSGP